MTEIKKAGMVKWLEPRQLVRTGFETLTSTIFGKHADRRLLQPAISTLPTRYYYDFTEGVAEDKDYWIDYIADVGDGFDSTYAMAYYLTRPHLKFDESLKLNENGNIVTDFGNLLILGGDEVYPTASHSAYQEKLVIPYEKAFSKEISADSPTVFAIPGNHDWYDSLVSFSRLFCEKIRFAGWETLQDRSYFAIKLVRGWWLFGTDMQLDNSLDKPQTDYFREVMKKLAPEDSIILCNAVPHWINSKIEQDDKGDIFRAMGFFEGNILKHRVAVYLAGDLHHYRRHENAEIKKQKITAGGGGAFLHPTQIGDVKEIGRNRKYDLKKSFPDETVSRQLFWQNLPRMGRNWFFGIVTAIVYLLTAKAFQSDIGGLGLSRIGDAIHTVVTDALLKPSALLWVILILGGFILFTDTHSKLYRWVMSPIHALAHLTAAFFISWGAAFYVSGGRGIDFGSIGQILLTALLIFVGGWVIGSIIMALYLIISITVFGRHGNEAYGALGICDYKSFIRLKIDKAGNLTIYPIGIQHVPREWKDVKAVPGEPQIIPDDPKASLPELIEKPITIQKLKPNPVKDIETQDVEETIETRRIMAV